MNENLSCPVINLIQEKGVVDEFGSTNQTILPL
jgi:hypothetical protein